MTSVLFFLSILGIGQTLFITVFFFLKKKISKLYILISGLCLDVSVIMLTIVLSVVELSEWANLYEFLEYIFTLSFGPLLYYFSLSFLGENETKSPYKIAFHFLPVILYSVINLLWFSYFGIIAEIPIWVPLTHMQLYTIWLIIKLFKSLKNQEFKEGKGRTNIMVNLSSVLILVHVLQWIRFVYSEFSWSDFIIPISSFIIFYLVILIVFTKTELLKSVIQKKNHFLSNSDLRRESESLDKLITENEIFRDSGLSIDLLSEKMGLPSYKVSYLINNKYKMGFNDFINRFRIEEAKKLLSSTEFDHYTIEAISQDVGFNSRSTFYAAFKKETGMTPSVFKEKVCSDL